MHCPSYEASHKFEVVTGLLFAQESQFADVVYQIGACAGFFETDQVTEIAAEQLDTAVLFPMGNGFGRPDERADLYTFLAADGQ